MTTCRCVLHEYQCTFCIENFKNFSHASFIVRSFTEPALPGATRISLNVTLVFHRVSLVITFFVVRLLLTADRKSASLRDHDSRFTARRGDTGLTGPQEDVTSRWRCRNRYVQRWPIPIPLALPHVTSFTEPTTSYCPLAQSQA